MTDRWAAFAHWVLGEGRGRGWVSVRDDNDDGGSVTQHSKRSLCSLKKCALRTLTLIFSFIVLLSSDWALMLGSSVEARLYTGFIAGVCAFRFMLLLSLPPLVPNAMSNNTSCRNHSVNKQWTKFSQNRTRRKDRNRFCLPATRKELKSQNL